MNKLQKFFVRSMLMNISLTLMILTVGQEESFGLWSGAATAGPDNLTCTTAGGDCGALDALGGNDQITINSGATVTGIVGANDGDDVITNYGTMNERVYGRNGDDTINNYGAMNWNINGNDGNDSITNYGFMQNVWGDNDNDTITNRGTVNGSIRGDAGVDTITNYGTVGWIIFGDANNDIVTNYGTVTGHIWDDSGNDTIINYGTVILDIHGGPDTDTISNYGTVDDIYGDAGDDTVTLGSSASVAGIVDGGGDCTQDTLILPSNAVVTTPGCNGTATIGASTVNWQNFANVMVQFVQPVPTMVDGDSVMSGWVFGGSLGDLVEQTGLGWWPGLPALKGVGVRVNVGNPLTVR